MTTRPAPARRLIRLAAGLALALVVAACGDDGTTTRSAESLADPATSSATPAEVTMEGSRFLPDELTVEAGTTVTFTNLDPFDHTVTATDGGAGDFDSGDLGQDEEFREQFDEPGRYDYFCEIHPTMRSTIVVE